MRHVNVPVFIPHLGCPNQCVFCNQRSISEHKEFCEESVRDEIEQVLSTLSPEDQVEIAFFGGSFTGIDQGLMCRLLDLAQSYVQEGRVASIRLSTRPDYIDGEILSILSRYAVKPSSWDSKAWMMPCSRLAVAVIPQERQRQPAVP